MTASEILEAAPAERPPEAPEVGFFGIGAPKCGTTWLTEMLRQHPDVTIARVKEPAFLAPTRGAFQPRDCERFLSDWSWYADQFKGADEGDVLGDMSAMYVWNHETTPHLVDRYYPEARIVVMLRDPVDRAHSNYWGATTWSDDVPDSFREALEIEHFMLRNRYHTLLSSWFDVLDEERILVHLLEDVKEDPEAVVRETFEHVGVDPGFVPGDLEEPVKTSHVDYVKPLMKLAEDLYRWGLGPVVDAVNAVGIGPLLKKVGKREVEYPEVDPEVERWLREELDDEIRRLEDLIGRDLSRWRADGT